MMSERLGVSCDEDAARNIAICAQIMADLIDQRGMMKMRRTLGWPEHPMHNFVHDMWEREQYRLLRGPAYWEIVRG